MYGLLQRLLNQAESFRPQGVKTLSIEIPFRYSKTASEKLESSVAIK